MGLDIILSRGMRSEKEMEVLRSLAEDSGEEAPTEYIPVTWKQVEAWGDFPFTPTTQEIVVNSGWDGEPEYNPETRISEITGMSCDLSRLSFRGKRYEQLAVAIGLPHSFYDDLEPEQVIEQAQALGQWLAEATGPDGQPIMARLTWQGHPDPRYEEDWRRHDFERLKSLHKLLAWMATHQLGTHASF